MSKSFLFLSFCMMLCVLACTETPKKNTEQTAKKESAPVVDAPIVGGNSDEHGCKASAGYTWSVVKNSCIRVFEDGIRLNPKAADLDKTLSAFIVFNSESDDTQAELIMPREKKSVLLAKDKKNGAGKWTNETYVLTQWKGMYTLEDNKKKILYEGMVTK